MYGANDLTYNGNIANSSIKTFDLQCCTIFSPFVQVHLTWIELSGCLLSVVSLLVCLWPFLFFIFPRTTYVVNKAWRHHYLFEGEIIGPHLFPKGNENALFTLILKIFQSRTLLHTSRVTDPLRATLKRLAEWIVWRCLIKFVTKYPWVDIVLKSVQMRGHAAFPRGDDGKLVKF